MAEKYRIGRHEFDSREEWENALSDLKKIRSIVERADLDNPKHVLAIYNLLREGNVTFSSELGDAFFCDISDRVAQNSQDMMKAQGKGGMTQGGAGTKQSKIFKIIGIGCMVLACICFLLYGYSEYSERKATRKLEEIQQQKNITQAVNWYMERLREKQKEEALAQEIPSEVEDIPETENVSEEEQEPEILQEYATMHKQYPHMIGWLHVADTQIDLPVMQTTDNDYYLHKNIDGAEDINGTLFMDYRDDISKPSTNLIIYGHNMKSGEMFGGLKQYLETSYASRHDKIQFDTIYEKQSYQLIAVCLSKVGYQDDDVTHYYDFIDAESAEDFQTFLKNVRESAVYDNTQDVTEGDKFLTLSTCNSYVEDGRLFLVAKKIQ